MPTSVEVGFACSVTRNESSSVRKINLLPFSFIVQIRSSNFQQQKLHSIIADDSICVKPYRELDGGAELATWCRRKDRWRGWVGDFGYESNDHGQKNNHCADVSGYNSGSVIRGFLPSPRCGLYMLPETVLGPPWRQGTSVIHFGGDVQYKCLWCKCIFNCSL
jgi:hypothetical protein